MKQRLIGLTLSLALLLQLLPLGVFAAEGTDAPSALTGQIYTYLDGKEHPLDEKSDPVAIDPEEGDSGIWAEFPQPEESGTFHYLWLYSADAPASVSLKDMTPVGVNQKQWAMEREKYGDPALLFSAEYGGWNKEGLNTFPALPIGDIIMEKETKTEELYVACLCVYVDNAGNVLTSGYTASSVRVSYAPAAPVTGIRTELVYWPEDQYIYTGVAEGRRYEVRTDASSSGIAALVYDSNGKELEYNTKYLWFYGKNATHSLSGMIPVGMTKAQWEELLAGSAPEDYLKAQYADGKAPIWSGAGAWNRLPVLPVGEILGGDTDYLAGTADNGLYFTCCAVWGDGSETFAGLSEGTVQVSFYGAAPTLTDYDVSAAPIAFDAPVGSTAELSCRLNNYSGTPDYQWYRLDSEEDSDGTPIEGANAAAFAAPYPDTPGENLYCCAVTYLDDLGRSKTLRSRTARLTRYPTAMVEIQAYPGLLDLTPNTTPEGNYIHYVRQTPSGDIQRADAYQSVGSPVSLSLRFDVDGLEQFSRLEIAWYVSREADGFVGQELVATHTYDTDLLEKYSEAMKGYDGKDVRELNRRRACFDQLLNEHLDLPAQYAAAAGLIRVTAVARTYSTVDGAEYCFTDRKTLSVRTLERNEDLFEVDKNGFVTKYIGCETTITFPQTKNGQPVTGIGNLSGRREYGGAYRAFARSLVIPEGYTAIADFAFERLASIQQVRLPSTLKSIGRYAFCETDLQNTLTLPGRLESIGARAFYATPIAALTFGADTFPTMGSWAFANCKKLTVVTFPAGAQGSFAASFTGDGAFADCSTLRSVQNQTAITDLDPSTEAGRSAINNQFGGTPLAEQLLAGREDDTCFSYERVSGGWAVARVLEIPADGVVSFPASYRDEPVTAIGTGAPLFDAAAGVDPLAVTGIVLLDTVTAIGANAFSGCKSLTAVTFPAALTEIGDSAFSGCKGLRGTLSFPNGTRIGQRAFQDCRRVTAIQVEGCSIGHEAFRACISLKTVSGDWTPDFGVDYPASGGSVRVEFQPFPFTQAVEKFYEKQMYTLRTNADGSRSYAPGSGSGTVYYSCPSCGAELICEETTAATSCPYCGNPTVVPGKLSGALKPDYVLPFKLSKEDAVAALKKHCKGKMFLPRSFTSANHLQEIRGVYVPFWMFDGEAEGDAVYETTQVRTYRRGDERVTETSHFHVYRAGSVAFEKVPVDASSKMPDDHMDSIEPYDYGELKPFSTAYLPGFLADKFDVSVEDSRERADRRCAGTLQAALRDTVQGYQSCITTGGSTRLRRGRVRYALMPVWMLSTKWQGKDFLFAMNGQTGRLVGDLPMSWGRFWSVFAAIAVPLSALSAAVSVLLLR